MEHVGGASSSLIELAKNKLDLSVESHYDGRYADSMRWCRGAILSAVRGLLEIRQVYAREHADVIVLFERCLLREGLVKPRHATLVMRELQRGETSGEAATAGVSAARSARLLTDAKEFVRYVEDVVQELSLAREPGREYLVQRSARGPASTGGLVHKPAGQTLIRAPSRFATGIVMPAGLFFHCRHTWLAIEGSGEVRIGMDDFAQKAIGSLHEVELREVGDEVGQGANLFSVRQGGRMARFVSPAEGTVSAVNEAVARDPQIVREDPYGAGWICKMFPTDLSASLHKLKIAVGANQWIRNEMVRLYDALLERRPQLQAVGATLHNGGISIDGVLEGLDDETWAMFTRKFLGNKDETR